MINSPAPCSAYLRPTVYADLVTSLHKLHPALDAPATVVMQLRVAALFALRYQVEVLSEHASLIVREYINLQLDSLRAHGDFTTSSIGFTLIASNVLDSEAERLLHEVMSCIAQGSEQTAFEALAYAKHILLALPYIVALAAPYKNNQHSVDALTMQAAIIRYLKEAEDLLIDAP